MTLTSQSPLSINWVLAILLALTLAFTSFGSPITLAEEDAGQPQTEENDDDDDDDDDEKAKGNQGKGKQNKPGNDQTDSGKPHCQKSGQFLFLACQHEAKAHRWYALAECENILDQQEHTRCFAIEQEIANDAKRACNIQRGSRREACTAVGQEVYEGWAEVDFLSGEEGQNVVGNTYFPLTAITSSYLTANTTITREVTDTLREIDGVACKLVVEEERDAISNLLLERVERLYSQDRDDSVWTCGVLRQQFSLPGEGEDPVVVSTNGSWQGASQAGIAMLGQPAYGDTHRRSFTPGIDEELAEVIYPDTVDSDFLCDGDCIILRITSPLSPGGYRDEYYKNGIGLIHSEDQNGENDVDLQP